MARGELTKTIGRPAQSLREKIPLSQRIASVICTVLPLFRSCDLCCVPQLRRQPWPARGAATADGHSGGGYCRLQPAHSNPANLKASMYRWSVSGLANGSVSLIHCIEMSGWTRFRVWSVSFASSILPANA